MNNFIKNLKFEIFPISIILILAFSRLIPHPPNFTPVIAVAIMSGYFFKNIGLSCAAIIISMLLSDFVIGFHSNLFVYISLISVVLIFSKINTEMKIKNLYIFGFFGSFIFFLVSNFGVWLLSGMYEMNLGGLISCYFLAIPFFVNTILSTILFTYTAFFVNNFYYKKFYN